MRREKLHLVELPPFAMEEDDSLSATDTEGPDTASEQEQSERSASKDSKKREKLQKKLRELKDAYDRKGRGPPLI